MVRILPIVGAAALFAQSAFAAAVPVRRTYDSNNNNYNQGSSYNQGNSYQQGSSYQQQQQEQQQSNNYGSNNYNVGQYNQNQYQSQESNNYNNYNQGQYQQQDTSSSEYNQYQTQESNQYNNYDQNQYQTQESNQYNNNYNQYTTTVATELAQETQVMDTTSTMMEDTTSSMMMEDTTSTMMAEETQAAMDQMTTSSSYYSMPTYGSGSSNNNGYNNCVQQCMAQFGAPPSTMTQESLPPPSGTGAVHTILVAPDGAGLRYMPFAVNASIGDTIRYVWTTPNNHTATLSSALAVCNKSGIAEQRNFVSGVRNASAGTQVFDVTVETTDTQFFYCSVAQHCEKGMFGMINPGNNIGGQNSVGTMMASLMQSNPQLQAAYEYMRQNVTGTSAANWGMGIPMDGIPQDQYEQVAANILFTQANFAANPGMLETNQGATTPDGSPVQIVSGLNVLLSDTSSTPVPSLSHSAVASPTGSLTPVNANADATGAAFSTRSVGTWAAAVIAVAGWLLI